MVYTLKLTKNNGSVEEHTFDQRAVIASKDNPHIICFPYLDRDTGKHMVSVEYVKRLTGNMIHPIEPGYIVFGASTTKKVQLYNHNENGTLGCEIEYSSQRLTRLCLEHNENTTVRQAAVLAMLEADGDITKLSRDMAITEDSIWKTIARMGV